MEPTRKRKFNGRLKTPRSRTGCMQCRRRRLKCDEQKPCCKRCVSSQEECSYAVQLTWRDEPCQKTRAWCSVPDSPKPLYSETASMSSTPLGCPSSVPDLSFSPSSPSRSPSQSHADQDYIAEACPSTAGSAESSSEMIQPASSASLLLRPSRSLSDLVDKSPFAKDLFDFYVHRMCMNCILLDTDSKSYRKVIVPIALRSSLVFNSLLALAASQIESHHAHKQKALQYQGLSLRALSHQIDVLRCRNGTEVDSQSEILGAILMLCLIRVMDNTFKTSRHGYVDMDIHSSGARCLLEGPNFDITRRCNLEMSSFLGQMLSARHVLRYTTLTNGEGDEAAFDTALYWLSKTTRPPQEINCFIGCSNEFSALLCDLVSCIRQHGRAALKDPWETRVALETRIRHQTQDQLSSTDGVRGPSSAQTDLAPQTYFPSPTVRFSHVSEAYKHAALILTQYLSTPEHPADQDRVEESIEVILSEPFMRSALSIPKPGKSCRSSPLWPTFIAACHASNHLTRMKMSRYLEDTMKLDETTCDVLQPLLEIIQSAWTQQDLRQLDGCFYDSEAEASNWQFPWERVLAEKGWTLCWG